MERLRLEKGIVGVDFQHLAAAPKLTQLELVDFKIVPGFREALKHVKNIEKMLLIPQYMEEVARWDDTSVILGPFCAPADQSQALCCINWYLSKLPWSHS